MYAFNYSRPATQAEAIQLLQSGGQALAGGQTLLASMKMRLAAPEQLVDLSGLAELAEIDVQPASVTVGAMVRHGQLAASEQVRNVLPALADLAQTIGDRQVRAMGTIGGSVANNDPAADYPAALLGLGASVHTSSRQISADDFFQGMFDTALNEGELITAIRFPVPRRAAYAKFYQPASRFALIGVFVAQFDSGVRVAVTGGGNGVFRHAGIEAALAGNFSPDAIASINTDESLMSSDLHACSAYRAHLVGVMARRAVARALG